MAVAETAAVAVAVTVVEAVTETIAVAEAKRDGVMAAFAARVK